MFTLIILRSRLAGRKLVLDTLTAPMDNDLSNWRNCAVAGIRNVNSEILFIGDISVCCSDNPPASWPDCGLSPNMLQAKFCRWRSISCHAPAREVACQTLKVRKFKLALLGTLPLIVKTSVQILACTRYYSSKRYRSCVCLQLSRIPASTTNSSSTAA